MSKKGFLDRLFSSNKDLTLTELQKEIYRRENDVVLLSKEAGKNKAKIDETNKKVAADKEALDKRLKSLIVSQNDLATSIAGDKRDPKNKKVQKEQTLWQQQLKAAQKELQDHQEVILEHQKKQELASQKLAEQSKKAAEQVELSYQQQKEKTFKIAADLLVDQEGLKVMLAPLAEPRKSAKGISGSQIFSTVGKGLSYAWKHGAAVKDIVSSVPFYQNEAAKIQAILEGKAQYDPSNPPFFIRLLKDPDTIKMLSENVPVLNGLVKELTPFLTDIVLKELGKIDTIKKDFDAQKKDIEELPKLHKDLKSLKSTEEKNESNIKKLEERIQALESLKASKEFAAQKKDIEALPQLYEDLESLKSAEKQNKSSIIKLEKKLQKLESLQASYERAVLLQALQGAGINGDYIKGKLLPVVQEVVGAVLAKPETLVKLGSLAADITLTKEPEKKQALLEEILKTIDISVLTKNAKLSEFLLSEGQNLAKGMGAVIASNPKLKKILDSFQVSDSLIQDGIPLALELADKILKDSKGVSALYEALKPVILDSTPDKIVKATTLEEVEKLGRDNIEMLISMAAKLPDILLQDDLLIVVKEKLPGFLEKHKSTLAKLTETLLPKVIKQKDEAAKALAAKCTSLDNDQVNEIVKSTVVRLLKGVDPKFYGQAVPIAIDLVKNAISALSLEEIKAINDSLKIIMDKDAGIAQKNEAQGKLIKIVTHLLGNEAMQEVLAKKLPALLKENSEVLKVIVNNAATIPALKKFGLDKTLLDATTSLVVDIASTGLAQIPKLIEINKAFSQCVDHSASQEARKQAMDRIVIRTEEVVLGLSPILETTLPEYLQQNKKHLLTITQKVIAQEGVKAQLDKAGVSADLAMEMAGVALDTAPALLPVVTKFASDLVKSTISVLSPDEVKAINDSLKIIMDKDAEIARKDKAQGELIKIITHVLENGEVQKVLAQKLPELLKENTEVLQVIGNNVANISVLKKYELDKSLVDATTSLVVGVSSTGLAQLPKLMELNKAFTQYTAPKASKEVREQALNGIISSAKDVVLGLSTILETDLPGYLVQNKGHLLTITEKVIAQEGVKAQLDQAGVPADLAMEMAGVALDTVPALLPVVTKLANAVLADQRGVETIVTKVQDLVVLLDKEKKASTPKDKDKVKKEIEASGTVLANSVLDFINNPKNPKVREVIDKDVPKFLEDNAKQIGATLDKFLNNTVIGRNLKVKGEEIIKVASKKVPGLVDIVTQYQQGKYFSVMSGAVGLLRDPQVRHLVARGAAEGIRYAIQKSYTSYRTRRNKWNENLKTISEGLLAFVEVDQNKKKDLGDLLLNLVQEKSLGERSKTMEYMFIDKDLKGIAFDHTNPIPLENIAIKGFSFDKAVFKDRSFNNSEISNCSFAKVQFKGRVSFDGATIDAKSLKTLLPAIRKYNKKNKENPITLDNVKIVGDISKISFKDIQMENPDFTGATLDKGKTFKTHLKDAYVGGNPVLPKSEELSTKVQEIGAEIGRHLATAPSESLVKRAMVSAEKSQGSGIPGV